MLELWCEHELLRIVQSQRVCPALLRHKKRVQSNLDRNYLLCVPCRASIAQVLQEYKHYRGTDHSIFHSRMLLIFDPRVAQSYDNESLNGQEIRTKLYLFISPILTVQN